MASVTKFIKSVLAPSSGVRVELQQYKLLFYQHHLILQCDCLPGYSRCFLPRIGRGSVELTVLESNSDRIVLVLGHLLKKYIHPIIQCSIIH